MPIPDENLRDDHALAGHVTCAEAKEILLRFNTSHFRHPGSRARYSIPANPKRDDDIRLGAFIARVQHLEAIAHELIAGPDASEDDLDALIDRLRDAVTPNARHEGT